MRRALEAGDFPGVCTALGNALEAVTVALHPEVGELKEQLRRVGAPGVLMTGSGPTVFALARSREEAERIAGAVGDGMEAVIVTEFSPVGVGLMPHGPGGAGR